MDILKLVILLTILVIIIGCFFLVNIDTINSYLTQLGGTASNERYNIHSIDSTDVKFINLLFPDLNIDLNNKINKPTGSTISTMSTISNTSNTSNISPFTNTSENDMVDMINIGDTNTLNNSEMIIISPGNDPLNTYRGTVPDKMLLSPDSNNRDFGYELPWDREVGFCEVLKGTDNDLYKNVQNSTTLTIY